MRATLLEPLEKSRNGLDLACRKLDRLQARAEQCRVDHQIYNGVLTCIDGYLGELERRVERLQRQTGA